MILDINTLRKNFASMSNADLRKLTEEALSLTPNGLKVLKEEVTKRNLPLLRAIDNVFIYKMEMDKLVEDKCDLLRDQSCPECDGNENLLNAKWIRTLGGKTFLFACGKCLIEQKNKKEINTSLFGWWHPCSFLATYNALKENNAELKEVETGKPTKTLIEFATKIVDQEFRSTMMQVDVEVNKKSR